MIEFFYKNNLKVIDVICGENNTIALTHNGDVWSWGYGGKKLNQFLKLFITA